MWQLQRTLNKQTRTRETDCGGPQRTANSE